MADTTQGLTALPSSQDLEDLTVFRRIVGRLAREVGKHVGAAAGSIMYRLAALEAFGETGLADSTPAAVGTAAVGTGTQSAREDHVHAATTTGVTAGALLTSGDWATSRPANITDAINRMSALLKTLNTNTAIP